MTNIFQSQQILNCQGPETQVATLQPYVAHIAVNLWGHDLLQQWGAVLSVSNPSTPAKNMMINMHFNPCRGLGKKEQGTSTFTQPEAHTT